jgi:hypothetical protein
MTISQTDDVSDPRPGIRAVLLTGFFAGNVCGLLYALLTGRLFENLGWIDSYALLAFVGAMMGVGIVGTMVGAFVALSARLLLHGMRLSESWWTPVVLSGLTSGLIGLCVAVFLVGALFEPSSK